MKKRLLAFLAVTLSVLFVLPIASPIVTFAANALPRDEAPFVSELRNVALNKLVTVTEGRYIDNSDWSPAKLVDGESDRGLHFQAEPGVYDMDITEENAIDVTIDLRGKYTLSSVRLKTPAPSYSWGALPYGWILYVSEDGGDTYQEVINVTSGNAYDSQVGVPAELSTATHIKIHIYDDSHSIDRGVGVNYTAIGELEAMGVPYNVWTDEPEYVDNNPSALDTREGTLSYTPSADGKTVTISYYDPALQETKSYIVPNNNNYLFGGYAGVDDLGRSLSEAGQNGVTTVGAEQEKYVGVFYFLWHGMHDSANATVGKAWNLQAALEANGGYSYGTVGASGDMHWFAEPLYGYYHGNDEYVYRKHAELLMNAGVDFLYFDITNNYSYTDRALTLMKILQEYSDQGYDVPQVVFYTNTDSILRIREIYADIYSQNLYPDTWFRIDGKPVVVCRPSADNEVISAEVGSTLTTADFFTIKRTQWPNDSLDDVLPNNMSQNNNSWPWMDFHWPQRVYTDANGNEGAISVSLAQHGATGKFSDSATKASRYQYNRGRSYISNGTTSSSISYSGLEFAFNSNTSSRWTAWNNDNTLSYQGLNFQEQFDYALAQENVKYILITGWNEWVATNYYGQSSETADDVANANTKAQFVDAASVEFSRDMEMTKGYYFDNYYMQLVSNIQKAKGTAPYIIQDQRYPINVTGSFDQWKNIVLTYTDPKGDASYRNHIGYGPEAFQIYTNETGRNDIVASKITSDTKNVYFYIETAEVISAATEDAWMQVYVNIDRNNNTGWYGYDYIINYAAQTQFVTTVAKYTGTNNSYQFTPMDETVAYQVKENKMMISVPLSQLGITNYNAVNFEFKVVDGAADMTTMESFYTDGDVAPLGRLNYIYHGRTTDALDPATNNAVEDVIPEAEKPVEYVKTEGFAKLWGTESSTNSYRNTLTTSDATSVGIRLTIPAGITVTDFATQFLSVTDRTDITLRVYRWNGSQSASVQGVVLHEETKQYMATSDGACTVVVNIPATKGITDGDFFFVWTSASGKTQAAAAANVSGVATNVSTYLNGSSRTGSRNTRTSISYLKTTDTVATPVDATQYTQVNNQKAHVILLAGQSNASGSTPLTDLALHESKNYARYQAGFSNVKILYWNDYQTYDHTPDGNSSNYEFVNVTTGQGANINQFGIELGLAEYLSETYPGETFYLIKSAIGGSMLPANGASDQGSYWLNNGSTEGRAYTVFKNCVTTGLQKLADQGLDPEVIAFMWMQGESDATVAANATNYLSNMNSFKTQLTDMIPDQYEATNGIAILDSSIATNACWNFPSQVNSAKRQFAEQSQNHYYLDTTDLVATADAAHYGASDMIKLGRAFGEGVVTVLKNCGYVAKAPSGGDGSGGGSEAVRYNVALGKAAYADNAWASVNWGAGGLTDGFYGEYLPDSYANGLIFQVNSSAVVGMTIVLPLVGTYTIDQIDLHAWTWQDFKDTSTFPTAYTIDAFSTETNDWYTIYTATDVGEWKVENGAKVHTFTPVTTDKIRITINAPSVRDDFTAIGELMVWGVDTAPADMVNAALNKGTLVQPETNTLAQGPAAGTWDPARMTDGKIAWGGAGLYLTNTPDGTNLSAPLSSSDLLINLEDVYDLYYFELYPGQYSPQWIKQGYGLPSAYTIYYSVDGLTWEEAVSVDGGIEVEYGIQTLYLDAAVRAKYLKITINDYAYNHYDGDAVPDWSTIGEFKAMGTLVPAYTQNTLPNGVSNVALGGTVNSGGTTLNWDGEWNDQNMVDGVIPSVGVSQGLFFVGSQAGNEYGSAPNGTRTVLVDLGGTYEVYGYDLHAMQVNQDKLLGYTYPAEYIIYTSPDNGGTWEPAYYFMDSTDQVWVPYHTAIFDKAMTATQVKIEITHWTGNAEVAVPQGIGEFVLYGKDLNAAANVAVGKPISKTGGGNTWGAIGDGWGLQFVNDGLTVGSTGVSSALMYDPNGVSGSSETTGSAVGATITIDLQGSYDISKYILWQGMAGENNLLPAGFTFSVSTDGGSSYTVVDTVTDYTSQTINVARELSQTYTGVTHVRLAVTANSPGGLTLIGELEVIGTVRKTAGIGTPDVTNKLTVNSVKADSAAADYPDTKLIDGNTTTSFWQSAAPATGGAPVNVTADLGSVYEVDSVILYSASADASTLPRNFRVEVSYNGVTWTTVGTYTGVVATGAQGEAYTAKFARTYAQYVRVVITGDSEAGYSEIAELAVCGSAHSLHVYTEKAATEAHLASAATCQAQAVYYVSCPCGANGTATFVDGGFAAHDYVNLDTSVATKLQDANCSTATIYAKQCSACGKLGGGVFASGSTTDHDFSAHEAHTNYLVSEKTCENYGIYYCSCATCNLKGSDTFEDVEGGKAPHTEDEGTYDKTTGERTYCCDVCEQATRTVGVQFNMSITLGTSLDINYFAEVDPEATNPVLTVEAPGNANMSATIVGVPVGAGTDGRVMYQFTYSNVGPQNVGTTVNLSLSCDDNNVHNQAHAAEEYLEDLKADENETATAIAAADALLVYAAAAKRVVTADESIDVNVDGYVNVSGTDKSVSRIGQYATFKEATVWFDSVNRIRFTVEIPEGTTPTFKMKVNDGEEFAVSEDCIKRNGNTVTIYTTPIEATGFDDVYTLTAYSGSRAGASATYSIKSYAYTMQSAANKDPNQVLLAKALYMYGLAAKDLQA